MPEYGILRGQFRKVGSPDDVLQAVRYLISAGFVTGHVLPVDGGRLLGPKGPPDGGGSPDPE